MLKTRYRKIGIIFMTVVTILIIMSNYVSEMPLKPLKVILGPVAYISGSYLGFEFEYVRDIGYVNHMNKIIIARECSGLRFLLILLFLLGYMFYRGLYKEKSSVHLLISGIAAYLVTIIANASRIIAIVNINSGLKHIEHIKSLTHYIVGVAIYFSFTVIFYCILNWFLGVRKYEKVNETMESHT